MTMVNCVTCGLLSLRHRESQELRTADARFREDGTIPAGYVAGVGNRLLFEVPVCYVDAESLSGEREDWWKKINCGRECSKFMPLQAGLTPKDHVEMRLVQEVEQRAQAWRAEDLKWQKQAEALAGLRHQELRDDQQRFQKAEHKHGWGTTIVNGAVALLAAICGGIIGAWVTVKMGAGP